MHDEGQWRDCARAGILLPLPCSRFQSKGKTQDSTIHSLFLYVKERTTSEAGQAPYDADGESIPQLIKIPEHGRHLSTTIERVDHALLLVYQDMILLWRLHAWKYWCWLGSSVGDFGQADGWSMAAGGIASSWDMALRVVLHLTSLSTVRPQAASSGQSHFPVRY